MRFVVFLTVITVCGFARAGEIVIGTGATSGAVYAGGIYTCTQDCVINAAELGTALGASDVTVESTAGGDITVTGDVTWTSAHSLSLRAQHDVLVQGKIAGSAGALTLRADAACASSGKIDAGSGTLSAAAGITALAFDSSDLSAAVDSGSGDLSQAQLVDTTAQLQTIGPAGDFALGCDLHDAIVSVPNGTDAVPFTGTLDGLGHAIIGFSVSGADEVGLFGSISGATIRNLVFVRPLLTATGDKSGVLAGSADDATISDVAVLSATVHGGTTVGGLVGYAKACTIDSVYVTGQVSGDTDVGGVLGIEDGAELVLLPLTAADPGKLTNAASKASVSGNDQVGGLVGETTSLGQVATSWSAGALHPSSSDTTVGGAVATAEGNTISNVYWDKQASGVTASSGSDAAAGLTTIATRKQTSFGGFDFDTTWAIREDYSRPFLAVMQPFLDTTMNETSSGPIIATQAITFSVSMAPEANYSELTGIITFYDGTGDAAPSLGTGTITSNATSLTTSALVTGTHTVVAWYPGDDFYIENVATVSEVVGEASSTTALASEEGPIVARVTAVAPATGTPSGSVSFTVDGGATPTIIALDHGVATLDPSTLTSGTHDIVATYTGDASFGNSTSSHITVQVSGPTTSVLTVASPTTAYGDAVAMTATVTSSDATPTGSARFVADGSTILGEITLNDGTASLTVSSLTAGTHNLTVHFVPNDSQFTASISASVAHEVTQAASATRVTVQNVIDSVINLSVSVVPVPSTLGIPTGSVVVVLDDADVATIDLVNGIATYATSSLSRGNHVIVVRYSGDTNYTASTSDAQTVDVEPTGFRMAATPATAQVLVGGSAPFVLTLAPEADEFAEEVSFDCSGLPTDAFCTFSPSSTTIGRRGATVGLVVTTQTPVAAGPLTQPGVPPAALGALAALAFTVIAARPLRRRRALALALCTAFACSSDKPKSETPREGTPPGTYTITITAHSVNYTRTATVELTVE